MPAAPSASIRRLPAFLACLALASAFATPAIAYIGPGAGLSVAGSLLNTLLVVLLGIVAILAWPLRMLWKKLRPRNPSTRSDAPSDAPSDTRSNPPAQ